MGMLFVVLEVGSSAGAIDDDWLLRDLEVAVPLLLEFELMLFRPLDWVSGPGCVSTP